MTLTEAKGRIALLERELRAVGDLLADLEDRNGTLRGRLESAMACFENGSLGRKRAATMVRDQMRRCSDFQGVLRGCRERIGALGEGSP